MKSIASVLSIIALGFGLLGCPGSGGGGGGSTPAFAVSTTTADFGVVGNAYTSTLVSTGGTAPFTWTLFGGVLPNGLSLNAGTGVVSGTPDTAGNSTVDFTVTDSTGQTANGSVLFAVHPRTDLLSVNNSVPPLPGIGASSAPSISDNGRFVAFASSANNLIPGVSGSQIYIHDWQTNQTSLVSRDSGVAINHGSGISSAPSISSDGRFVAFVSAATNLVPGVSGLQIYLRDVQTGVTSLVSKDNSGNPATGGSIMASPRISGNGRFIAYVSDASNLITGVVSQQIYLYDTQTSVMFPNGQTTLISQATSGVVGNGGSSNPTISSNGRFVAFTSASSNLTGDADPAPTQIFLRDTQSSTTTLISQATGGAVGDGASSQPAISDDGGFVAFTSLASNLAPIPGGSGAQIFLRNTQANTTSLVSQTAVGGIAGNGASSQPTISDDGGFVAFSSVSTNLGAAGGGNQIYIRALP